MFPNLPIRSWFTRLDMSKKNEKIAEKVASVQ